MSMDGKDKFNEVPKSLKINPQFLKLKLYSYTVSRTLFKQLNSEEKKWLWHKSFVKGLRNKGYWRMCQLDELEKQDHYS